MYIKLSLYLSILKARGKLSRAVYLAPHPGFESHIFAMPILVFQTV